MRITLHGAAGGEVTGSAYLVETSRAKALVDCGLFQGGKDADAKNRAPHDGEGRGLDAVLITHGHLDHTGRLPLLTRAGFSGPIWATPATIEMTSLILRDAAKIQVHDLEKHNRHRAREGKPPLEPLYTPAEVEQTLPLMRAVPYLQPVEVAPGIHAEYTEAGHMLGSTSIRLTAQENGRVHTAVFSGDLGPRTAPILRDYEPFREADLVFLESTYGDRDHRPFDETVEQFFKILETAVRERAKVIVPTFAVGRAQVLTVLLAWAFREGRLKPFPVFLDSPMALEAGRIYARHMELFDENMRKFLREGSLKHDLATLRASASAEESKALNDLQGPCLIMAGAGMCTGGRILHHLRHNLSRPETHVLIVGHQSRESLGRRLVEGDSVVNIFGEKIVVRAQVHTLGGFSAHAGQTDLRTWFEALAPAKPRTVLTHGEDGPRTALAGLLRARFGLDAERPALGASFAL
ncbi:MAG: MBL fold metallo-hydrolase [Verrucomicrobiae bacterium]|nr:MBL fold metallo-hydrolase [Verrucomicrobiae bacterium]